MQILIFFNIIGRIKARLSMDEFYKLLFTEERNRCKKKSNLKWKDQTRNKINEITRKCHPHHDLVFKKLVSSLCLRLLKKKLG